MKNRRIIIQVVCLVVLLIGGCQESPKKTAGPAGKVTIGVASIVLSAPVIIAIDKGYFNDEGLEVTVKEYDFGKLCLEGMFVGEVDLATVAQLPIVMNSFKREDFSVVATINYNYDDSKIVIRKDRGIATGADLKGKTIGTPFGTTAHFFTDVYLNYHNIQMFDTKVVNIPAKDLSAALKEGSVDAISAFEPYAYAATNLLPDSVSKLPGIDIFRETFNLAAMKDFSENHPEAIRKVLMAIDRAISFTKQNRAETLTIVSRRLHVDEKFLETEWDDYVPGLSLDQTLVLTLEDQARWAIKNKLTDKTKIPNYLDFLDPKALRAVNPKAVTVIMK